MKRPVESLEDFKARIAAIVGDKREHIAGAQRPNLLLVRNRKKAARVQRKRRR
jgi:hypothetical protein